MEEKKEIYNALDTRVGWTKENGLCMECHTWNGQSDF